jgi:hypothetical protein
MHRGPSIGLWPLQQLKFIASGPSYTDNIAALALTSNPIYHACTKHINVNFPFIREKVVNKDIVVKFISTHDQLAHVFNKGLTSNRFCMLHVA